MEHLRVAGLVTGAVVEEVLHLRLRLSLDTQPQTGPHQETGSVAATPR